MNFEERLGNSLSFDALDAAEKITGKSYKEDEKTANLGLYLQILKSEDSRKRLIQNCDVYFGQPLNSYIQTIKDLKFEQIYEEQFYDECLETFYCFMNWDLGVLLSFESYSGKDINSGDFYYNWKPFDIKTYPHECTSTGGFSETADGKLVNVGHRDCREGVKYYLTLMLNYGTFVKPWIEKPFYWLTTRLDHKQKNHRIDGKFPYLEEVTQNRLKKFPERFFKEIMVDSTKKR